MCSPNWFRGEGHTRWQERGWESPNSGEGTYTMVLFIYMYFVIRPVCTISNLASDSKHRMRASWETCTDGHDNILLVGQLEKSSQMCSLPAKASKSLLSFCSVAWLFYPPNRSRAGIFKESMGARNRGGIGLSYRPARLHRLAEFIPWNRFLGSINV